MKILWLLTNLLLSIPCQSFLASPLACPKQRLPASVLSSVVSQSTDCLTNRQPLSNHNIEVLSKDPLVYRIPNLLSRNECEEYKGYASRGNMTTSNPPQVNLDTEKLLPSLAAISVAFGVPPILFHNDFQGAALNVALSLVGSLLLAYQLVLPLIRRFSDAQSRTSQALALNTKDETQLIGPLMERITSITSHENWEAPVVTHYDPGAVFKRHNDASLQPSEWATLGGQRVVTVICYLQNGGGPTYFDQLDLAVEPKQGTALVFFPARSDLIADERTTHESMVSDEEKWIVQIFGRIDPVPPPLGLPN